MFANINIKKPIGLDVSSRAARRKAMALLLFKLESILRAEGDYAERIPENLKGGEAYASAEDTVDIPADAMGSSAFPTLMRHRVVLSF
jgi:hypothetical protein